MRNLKKFLALVLAVMMTLSLMVTANAAIDTDATVTDKDSVTEEFKEAVAVLNGLGIITGYKTGDDEYEFRPGNPITRQETTALIYRLHSGDVDDTRNNLYSTVDNIKQFTDVNPNGGQQWSAGYIGYCANQGIIKGVSATRFNPTGNVTGYQVLAMALRAIGYGQNGEFEGTGWQTRVATTATKIGILDNVNDTNYAGTLSAPATRELVAEIIFQAALQPTVTYTPGLGYVYEGVAGTVGNPNHLGWKKFNLNNTAYTTIDDWGRPGYYWFRDLKETNNHETTGNVTVATIMPKPVQEYTSVIDECDLAEDLGIKTSETFDLYLNGKTPVTTSYLVVATDTVTKVGGQGRLTQVYTDLYNGKGDPNLQDRVVMVDTFLAKVDSVSPAVKDSNGHVIVESRMTLSVYDKPQNGTTPNPSTRIVEKGNGADWEYSVGDMILLNAYTDHTASLYGHDHNGESNGNLAAYETEPVLLKRNETYLVEKADVLHVAKSTVAKQTVVYWNQEKHNVGGEDYNDQIDLFLDVAGTTVNTDFTWYFDDYNNIIGIGESSQSNYGVITSIYSALNQGSASTDGTAKAIANVLYADGTTGTITIDRFLMSAYKDRSTTGSPDDLTRGRDWAGQLRTSSIGTVELIPMYDYNNGAHTMKAVVDTVTKVPPRDAAYKGLLAVAPVAYVNAINETKGQTGDGTGYYGILNRNLFKFVSSGDGTVTAIEVAGYESTYLDYGDFKPTVQNTVTGTSAQENTGVYAGLYNACADAGVSGGDNTKLYKNLGYLNVYSLDKTYATDYSVHRYTVRLDNNTKIMVRTSDTTTITVYNGLSSLPGDVLIGDGQEVDWADYNGDGVADVLFVRGTIDGVVTHGLFYYNGGVGQWNGVDKVGTLQGYLNGAAATVTFRDETLFNIVKNSVSSYSGHIFAVEASNGEITNLFGKVGTSSSHLEWIANGNGTAYALDGSTSDGVVLADDMTEADGVTDTQAAWATLPSAQFKVGTDGGNSYTKNTKVVTYRVTGASNIYNTSTQTVALGGGYALINGTSKVIGDDLSYLNLSGRVSDVTIVYENNSINSIVEIYVTTQADQTRPGGVSINIAPNVGNAMNGGNEAALLNQLKTGAGGVVLYTSAGTATDTFFTNTLGITGSDNPLSDNLFFPFSVNASNANPVGVTLVIRDASGSMVYSESANYNNNNSALGGAAHVFAVNIGGTINNKGTGAPLSLQPGTYTFTITTTNATGIVDLSSGSFTMVAE